MARKSVLKAGVLELIRPNLESRNFKFVKSKEWFLHSERRIKQTFHVDFDDYGTRYKVEPGVSIRLEDVEAIFHRTSDFEAKYQSQTPTVSVSLWRLRGVSETRFQYYLAEEADCEIVARELMRDFAEVAEPYFQRNSNIQAIDSLLNSAPHEDCVHYVMDYLRCAHGLIAAKLTARFNYDQLVEIYRKRMESFANGFYVSGLERLIADLSSSS